MSLKCEEQTRAENHGVLPPSGESPNVTGRNFGIGTGTPLRVATTEVWFFGGPQTHPLGDGNTWRHLKTGASGQTLSSPGGQRMVQ